MPEHPVVAENIYRQKILLDPQDTIGKKILRDGIYDKTGLYFIEKVLSKIDQAIVFDVGASIGNHALRMSQYCHKVYLFEPQARIAAYLQQTMSLNNIKNWQICPFGLSDQDETLPLYRNLESNVETSFVADLKAKHFATEEAKVCVGDRVVELNQLSRLDFIKIDVEGFEAKVIAGLSQSIQQFRPVIFMEWDKAITKRQFEEYDLLDKLFGSYLIKAIRRNPQESTLLKKIGGIIRHFFSPGTERKRWIVGDFKPQSNYRHIVFVPQEKAHLIADLI